MVLQVDLTGSVGTKNDIMYINPSLNLVLCTTNSFLPIFLPLLVQTKSQRQEEGA